MRDLFEDIFKNAPLDPVQAARRAVRPHLRRRFYQRAEVEDADGEFRIVLDGRPVKTPARRTLAAPTRAVADEVKRYLACDLVFYRAPGPAGLVAWQAEAWDPVLAWVRETLGARFVLAEGSAFVAQPAQSLAAASSAIPTDPWRLGAMHAVTTLTGSALIAIALARGALSVDAAWAAAHVDEGWNMKFWGRDALALERRAARFSEMQAAATVLEAA